LSIHNQIGTPEAGEEEKVNNGTFDLDLRVSKSEEAEVFPGAGCYTESISTCPAATDSDAF
jgi:hypothetical protein